MLKVTNLDGKARSKLFMAPNPKSGSKKENRNKTNSSSESDCHSQYVCAGDGMDIQGHRGKNHG